MAPFCGNVLVWLINIWVDSPFLNEVWEREEIPEDLRKSFIVIIPTKGHISVYDFCLSRWFFRVILNRFKMSVEQRITEEQAGFRAERDCSDQIFLWEKILSSVKSGKHTRLLTSLASGRLSIVPMRHYGLPQKILSFIKLFYERFEFDMIRREGVSDFFEVETGVRQGRMLSPLLFHIQSLSIT